LKGNKEAGNGELEIERTEFEIGKLEIGSRK